METERNERFFKKTISSIGGALLVMVALMELMGIALGVLSALVELLPVSEIAQNVIYQLSYDVLYLAAFLIPAFVLRAILKKQTRALRPIRFAPRISPDIS